MSDRFLVGFVIVLSAFFVSIAALPVPECGDRIRGCESYGRTLCNVFRDWADINCKAFCGFCIPTIAPKTTTEKYICEDINEFCTMYDKSICVDFPDWAEANCRLHCSFCRQPVGKLPNPDTILG